MTLGERGGRAVRAVLAAIGQTGEALLGLAAVVSIWVGVLHSLATEREQVLRAAAQEAANLSRAFEENIVRTLKAVDQSLLYIRDSYERDPAAFDASAWTRSTQAVTNLVFQFTLIGKDGFLIDSNLMSGAARVDLSDREHFQVQRDGPGDALFVSKPVLGRVSHRWSIQLTRKLIAPDGGFDGVAVISLDPQYLSRFYESVDLGGAGSVALVGFDGVIRARAVRTAGPEGPGGAIGASLRGSRLLEERARAPNGGFVTTSGVDGVRRIVAYRSVRGFPLIVTVGLAEHEVLAAYAANRRWYLTLASSLSAALLFATALLVVRQRHLAQTRRRLRDSEAGYARKSRQFEMTLRHMSQGIMMVDAGGRVQVCNQRVIMKLGLPESLLAGQPLLDHVLRWQWDHGEFGEDGGSLTEELRAFILSGGSSPSVTEYERTRPNGAVLEIRSTPMPDGGFVRTYTDITRVKRNEASLRAAMERADRAAEAKSDFLATMSHEIRSPLSGLIGVVELLREAKLDDEPSRMVDMIHTSAHALLLVLNDILDFSKIEAGVLSVTPEPVELRALMTAIAQPHAVNAAGKRLALSVSVAPSAPDHVQTDPFRLRQILDNFLSNAVKFTQAGAIGLDVDVDPSHSPPTLRFAVADQGIGIAPEVLSKLFSPFVQADGSTSRVFGGTGLGLCISRRLADALGASIEVDSQPGLGSVFTLRLPLVAAVDPQPPPLAAPAPVLNAAALGRVLVVDDDPTNRWLCQRQLQRLGAEVEVAHDGAAALTMLRTGRYGLLVTDCHMPRMDGVALARAARADPAPSLRTLPILGLTADTTAAMRARCLAAGMTEIAIKPLTQAMLAQLLSAILAREPVPPHAEGPSLPTGGPVFDRSQVDELFDADDPEAAEWLDLFVAGAGRLVALLGSLLSAAPPDAQAIQDAAHTLGGSALSVGAVRLGEAARRLEQEAGGAAPERLERLQADIELIFAETNDAIGAQSARARGERATSRA